MGVAMELGRVGIWSIELRSDEPAARPRIAEAAAELEELGYGAVWLGGSPGVHHARPLLEATSRLVVATGILNIWEYEPERVAEEQALLAKDHPGRFVLGLGASHGPAIGARYQRPYTKMIDYLDRLDAAGSPAAQRVLAALGPRMLAASRDRAAGAHPYLVTAEHTRNAREILGPGPVLAPEVKVVLEDDLSRARAAARAHLERYLRLPNYTGNLLRLGFAEEDFADGGSDRLLDATFALGGVDAAVRRVDEHFAAGADHVAVQVITAQRQGLPTREWRELAVLNETS
ncbi:LLM class F420-dependent oxidoreductase [Actinomadura sp. NBRC 104425]|uniref:LLM class F420-dependent oxidoreductase n=1 Tax=Actinomadura sp. NBRC 104425 TaxID=3032204 RepID=UPI0024A088D2|nr:LLM class F420-dependent oxidoreductase [Actinomadura sp. NBRC 104425]GLZ15694.1 LLM class F420-dependent oxidoreductase [Actinomadura sp. NBRC 104425]